MQRVGIIGFGGIAQSVHLPAYLELEEKGKIKLVAVCDICNERFEKAVEVNLGSSKEQLGNDVKKYTDWHEMLEKEELDMVDICVPTYLHKEVTIGVFEHGINVLCEKPMSLCYEDCIEMCNAAKKADKMLMIGQCLRFCSAYNYLKKLVDEGTYGKTVSGVFQRLSPPPVWGWNNWFMNPELSGGCIFDLHIHDIDITRYIWGEPNAVSCYSTDVYSKHDIAHSRLMYDGFSVLAIGDWSRQGIPFSRNYSVALEKATVIFDDNGVTVYPREGEAFSPELDKTPIHTAEIIAFVDSLENGEEISGNTPEDSAMSVKLVKTLIESANKNGETINLIEK